MRHEKGLTYVVGVAQVFCTCVCARYACRIYYILYIYWNSFRSSEILWRENAQHFSFFLHFFEGKNLLIPACRLSANPGQTTLFYRLSVRRARVYTQVETDNEAYYTFHFTCRTQIELRREPTRQASVLYVCVWGGVCVANPWQGISGHFSIPGGSCYLTRTGPRDPIPAALACLGVNLPWSSPSSSHINKYQAYDEVHKVHFNMQICKYLIISKRREFGILKMQAIPTKKNKVNSNELWLVRANGLSYKFTHLKLWNLNRIYCRSRPLYGLASANFGLQIP